MLYGDNSDGWPLVTCLMAGTVLCLLPTNTIWEWDDRLCLIEEFKSQETCPGAALASGQAILGPPPVSAPTLSWVCSHLLAQPHLRSPGQAIKHCKGHLLWLLQCIQHHPSGSTGWQVHSDAGGCLTLNTDTDIKLDLAKNNNALYRKGPESPLLP